MRSSALAASLLLLAGVAATGCSGKGSTAPGNAQDISGTWAFSSSISNAVLEASCVGRTSVTVAQSGNSITETATSGSNSCLVAGQGSQTSLTGTVFSGQVNGSQVSFSDNSGCTYSGTIRGTPADTLAGNANCVLALNGTGYTFLGSWQQTT